jgi:lipooligosaccharide transport system permease protein
LSVYPSYLRLLVEAFPLYHGVEIMRTLAFGPPTLATLAHASYFLVMTAIGFLVIARRLGRLLLT